MIEKGFSVRCGLSVPGRSVSLGQLATNVKSNRATAIPEVLDHNEIEGSVVTIVVAGCQTKIAKTILDGKADYVLALKGIKESCIGRWLMT